MIRTLLFLFLCILITALYGGEKFPPDIKERVRTRGEIVVVTYADDIPLFVEEGDAGEFSGIDIGCRQLLLQTRGR